jgi:predicted nuclease of restriction endonuclease-like (RecB) superfamily
MTSNSPSNDHPDYQHLLGEIRQRIRSAQYQALKAVNQELITLYWDIGQLIVERQQVAGWGKAIVEQLAQDIRAEFPGIAGFSARNVWRIRDFYLSYRDSPKLTPMVAEIGWTHNLVILEKCKDELEREFYLRMTRRFGWTKNVLIHQIENQSYQKTLLNQTNFDQTLTEDIRNQAKLAIKDEYTVDFLELGDAYSERQLEQALLDRIEPFLREMGEMFLPRLLAKSLAALAFDDRSLGYEFSGKATLFFQPYTLDPLMLVGLHRFGQRMPWVDPQTGQRNDIAFTRLQIVL